MKRVHEINQEPQCDPHIEQRQNEIIDNKRQNVNSSLNDTKQKNKTHVQDQDAGSANKVEGNEKEKNKTMSNDKMQKNKVLIRFQATSSVKNG